MPFRHLTLLAIAALVLVLGAGFLANQRWVVRNLRYEAAEAERKRQSDPLGVCCTDRVVGIWGWLA
jgi:hypothetical protein